MGTRVLRWTSWPAMSERIRRWLTRHLAGPSRVPAEENFAAVVVKLDRLGDFVLALAAIRRVFEHFGSARCMLVVSPVAAEFAALQFPDIKRIVVPYGLGHFRSIFAAIGFRRLLGRFSANQVICLRHQRWDYDELLLSWIKTSRAVRTIDGYTRRLRPDLRFYECDLPGGFVPAAETQVTRQDGSRLGRELELHRQVLSIALGRELDGGEILPEIIARNEGEGVIVSPFGSEAIRDFPLPLLQVALKAIRARAGKDLKITLVGQAHQRGKILALARKLEFAGDVSVKLELSMSEYIDAICSAGVVLSADTATAHVATASNRRTIVALGGGHYGQFAPWSRSFRQRWLTKPVPCFGCNWECVHPQPYCLTEIEPEAMLQAVEGVLSA